MDKLYDAFRWLVDSTLGGSVVIVFIMIFLFIFRERITVRMRHILWLVVLVRLLLPVFPNSEFSILHITQVDFTTLSSKLDHKAVGQEEQHNDYITPSEYLDDSKVRQPGGIIDRVDTTQVVSDSSSTPSLTFKIVAWIWLIGVVLLISNLIVQVLGKKKQLKTLEPIGDDELLSILEACKKRLSIRRPVRLYWGQQGNTGPHIYGVIQPSIYIPQSLCTSLNRLQLSHIMMHELAHLKRHDMLWNLLGGIALSIHWMNPLVWLGVKWMKGERELACDACVLNELGEKEAVPYGMTIIEVLKSHTRKRSQAHVLHFYGADPHSQLERRIQMITRFRKGSYRLTLVSVLCIIMISTCTLTNAASSAEERNSQSQGTISISANQEPRILFETNGSGRVYDNVESAIRVADFDFKIPTELPVNYKLEQVRLSKDTDLNQTNDENQAKDDKKDNNKLYAIKINFNQLEGKFTTEQIEFSATSRGAGMEQAYQDIYEKQKLYAEDRNTNLLSARENDESLIEGVQILKAYFSRGKHKSLYYFWVDAGVQYQMGPFYVNNTGLQNTPNAIKLITSMKKPQLPLSEQYSNPSLLNADIYDTEDLKRGIQSVGLTPKLPMEVLDEFKAWGATVTMKVNFGYPVNEQDEKTKLFSIGYTRIQDVQNGTSTQGVQRFNFKQIRNNNIYETLKSRKQVDFERIDGEKFSVAVHPILLAGQEVYVTDKYKIDEALSSADEPDFINYYWKEGDVCYQVEFPSDGGDQMNEVVSALIVARPLALK